MVPSDMADASEGEVTPTAADPIAELRAELTTLKKQESRDFAVAIGGLLLAFAAACCTGWQAWVGAEALHVSQQAAEEATAAASQSHSDAASAMQQEQEAQTRESRLAATALQAQIYITLRDRYDDWHDDPVTTVQRRIAREAADLGCSATVRATLSRGDQARCMLLYLRAHTDEFCGPAQGHDGRPSRMTREDCEARGVVTALRRYWFLARDEYIVTHVLNDGALNPLWEAYYTPVISGALRSETYREVFCEMRLRESALFTDFGSRTDFVAEMERLASPPLSCHTVAAIANTATPPTAAR